MPSKKKTEENEQGGFREGDDYPVMPVTAEDYKNLLENPDKRVENQSAPAQELLNPHLFGR